MSIDNGLRDLVDATYLKLPEIFAEIRQRLVSSADAAVRRRFGRIESEAVTASLNDVLSYIGDATRTRTRMSNESLREVQASVHAGEALQELLRESRLAQAVTWKYLVYTAYEVIDDPDVRVAVLRHASARHFEWNDLVSAAIMEAWQQASAVFAVQSNERKKVATVEALLAGLPVSTEILNYQVGGTHLAASVWSGSPEGAARAIGSHVGVRPLVVTYPEGHGAIWIPWPRRVTPQWTDLSEVVFASDVRIAYGSVHSGLDGFGTSHRQALEAKSVANSLGLNRVWYDDVVLESLALRDLAATVDFVEEELGPLGELNDKKNVLLETLREYFLCSENAVLTAEALGVHPRTVAYRLKSAETKLGAEALHRGEFAVALRLAGLVGSIRDEGTGVVVSNPGLPAPSL